MHAVKRWAARTASEKEIVLILQDQLVKHGKILRCRRAFRPAKRVVFISKIEILLKDQRAFRGLHPETLNGAFHIIPHCLVIFESIKINLFRIFNKIDAFPGSAFRIIAL